MNKETFGQFIADSLQSPLLKCLKGYFLLGRDVIQSNSKESRIGMVNGK